MPSVEEYAKRMVFHLNKDNPPKGSKVGVAVETKEKGEKIIARVRELKPDAGDWTFNIIVVHVPEDWR